MTYDSSRIYITWNLYISLDISLMIDAKEWVWCLMPKPGYSQRVLMTSCFFICFTVCFFFGIFLHSYPFSTARTTLGSYGCMILLRGWKKVILWIAQLWGKIIWKETDLGKDQLFSSVENLTFLFIALGVRRVDTAPESYTGKDSSVGQDFCHPALFSASSATLSNGFCLMVQCVMPTSCQLEKLGSFNRFFPVLISEDSVSRLSDQCN